MHKKASYLNPNDAWIMNNLGFVYEKLKKYEEAIVCYKIGI
jgi:hypothetical protein